jgi:NAD-dependent dihydropyrimidine dehydrogenase PreA subunit
MKGKKILLHPETAALKPLKFDSEICDGCNRCVDVCQVDILLPNPNKGKPPVVVYPGECWYGGCCVAICPKPGAIRLNMPLMNRVHWKKKVRS